MSIREVNVSSMTFGVVGLMIPSPESRSLTQQVMTACFLGKIYVHSECPRSAKTTQKGRVASSEEFSCVLGVLEYFTVTVYGTSTSTNHTILSCWKLTVTVVWSTVDCSTLQNVLQGKYGHDTGDHHYDMYYYSRVPGTTFHVMSDVPSKLCIQVL